MGGSKTYTEPFCKELVKVTGYWYRYEDDFRRSRDMPQDALLEPVKRFPPRHTHLRHTHLSWLLISRRMLQFEHHLVALRLSTFH